MEVVILSKITRRRSIPIPTKKIPRIDRPRKVTSFSIIDGPRFLQRKSTVCSAFGPSHVILNDGDPHTIRVVGSLCTPVITNNCHRRPNNRPIPIIIASLDSTRVIGCTSGSFLTAGVDFVGRVTGVYSHIKTSIARITANVNLSSHVNGGFLRTNVN